jgi:Family of unknown function (DUF6114)
MGSSGKYMGQTEESKRAFTLSLIAGLLIVCNAVAVGVAGTYFPSIFPTLPGSNNNATVPFATIAVIALICGVLILFAAIMWRIKPANKKAWGILIVIFSIPSVITGGGFIIGFILGIVGGFLALRKKHRPTENSK